MTFFPLLSKPKPSKERLHYEQHKQLSKKYILGLISKVNKKYAMEYGNIAVRHTTTRWGSCSKKGNLNFSYKIFFLPPHLAEYIVAHELCHLKHFNHGANFWKMVEVYTGDVRPLIKELREFEKILRDVHLEG